MSEYDALEPSIRCQALVGRFLQEWAALESAIDQAIRIALRLDLVQSAIISVNIQMRNKLNLLHVLTDQSLMLSEEKSRYKKILDDVGEKLVPVRNMIAHHAFFPNEAGNAVVFSVVKARKKLEIPDVEWTTEDFEAKSREVKNAFNELVTLKGTLTNADLVKVLNPALVGGLLQGLFMPPNQA